MGVAIGLLLLVLERGPLVVGLEPETSGPGTAAQSGAVAKEAPKPAPTRQKTAPGVEAKRGASQPRAAAPAGGQAAEQLQPLQCDRDEAEAVVQRARSLATLSERGALLQLSLTRDWEFYSSGHRRSFVEAFSEADRCLQGQFRQLHFFYRGQLVATVSAEGAVEMFGH